jgi:hypothetical protein
VYNTYSLDYQLSSRSLSVFLNTDHSLKYNALIKLQSTIRVLSLFPVNASWNAFIYSKSVNTSSSLEVLPDMILIMCNQIFHFWVFILS